MIKETTSRLTLEAQFAEFENEELYLYPAFEKTVIEFLMGAEAFPPPNLSIWGEWKVLAEWIAANDRRLLIIISETVDIPYSMSCGGKSFAGIIRTTAEVREKLNEIYLDNPEK